MEKFAEETEQRAGEAAAGRIQRLLETYREPEYRRGVHAALAELNESTEPSEEDWQRSFEELESLVEPLLKAGWWMFDEFQEGYHEPGHGPTITARLVRSGVVLLAEYDVWAQRICFSSDEFPAAEMNSLYPLIEPLDAPVTLDTGPSSEAATGTIARRLGALGLLDPLHMKAAEGSDVSTDELLSCAYADWIFAPAAAYSGLSREELGTRLNQEEGFRTYYEFVRGLVGRDVFPDYVPSAAAIGVALWCWRNETAVEGHHLPDDVLMARVNIAVTKAVMPYLDDVEGTDWDAIEARLTDSDGALPDGRKISGLFGEGWPEVRRTVSEQLRLWKRLDEDLLGPEATLRLLSVGGATSYTRHWWGRGRWDAICERIVRDAIQARVPLPGVYRDTTAETLLKDLSEPDLLDDETLDWLIDMPGADADQPGGLRHHPEATRPVTREFTIHLLAEASEDEDKRRWSPTMVLSHLTCAEVGSSGTS
ncbi:hypothetical protein [Nocardiopsis lucentensis]|uniref:hypothetical protein n=1 Tax=Nocardiopsis lucentensis TaxID=53441 RepID=UPI00034A5CB1|nr:hypothetical protein [Nocardiopsis lucentensis]